MIFENVGDFGKVAHINAKLAREKISAKIEVCTPVIRKYIVEGIDKWIGDCKGKKNISLYFSKFIFLLSICFSILILYLLIFRTKRIS